MVDSIVIGSVDQQCAHTHAFLKGTGVFNPKDIAFKGKVQLACKLVAIVCKHLATLVCNLYLRFHIGIQRYCFFLKIKRQPVLVACFDNILVVISLPV